MAGDVVLVTCRADFCRARSPPFAVPSLRRDGSLFGASLGLEVAERRDDVFGAVPVCDEPDQGRDALLGASQAGAAIGKLSRRRGCSRPGIRRSPSGPSAVAFAHPRPGAASTRPVGRSGSAPACSVITNPRPSGASALTRSFTPFAATPLRVSRISAITCGM